MRIYRLTPDGTKWPPALQRGEYVLGDPKWGKVKHLGRNQLRIRSEDEAIRLLLEGYSIRVQTASAPSMVRCNLYIDDVPIT